MQFEYIDTDRLRLRMVDETAYQYVFENLTENEAKKFFGSATIEDFEMEKRRYAGGLVTFNKKCLVFHLLDKKDSSVIGWCGYHTWYIDHDRAEIGYGLFHEPHKKQGLMTEALIPILEYGFSVMNLHRIEAMISPDNDASIALVTKMGFQKEGVLREHYTVDGVAVDSAVYSLLKNEHKSN